MMGLALKATLSVALNMTEKEKSEYLINQLLAKHESDMSLMNRCLILGYAPENIFPLVDYDEKEDNYHVRIWQLIDIDSEEHYNLRILRE